jgi:translation initiation factor 4B
MDNQWRTKMRPDAAPKEPTSPVAPAARPRLNLQKRTVSEAVSTPAAGAGDSKASPFGAARPIDTATREREVEERRQLAIRQKKESDDKAKAEKAEKQKKEPKVGTDSNKDAIEPPKGGGNFEILQRAGEDESQMTADKETEETAAPAAPAAPAAAAEETPKETPKEAATNGSWRTAEAPADDNDGWSTVDTTKKRGRRGGRF